MNNVIFTKATIFRNVKDYKFVPKLEADKKLEIKDKISSVIKTKLNQLDLANVDVKVLNYLQQNDLIRKNASPIMFVDKEKSVSLSLFDGEHITIVSTGFGFDKSVFKNAKALADFLSSKINLVYNDEYGYLMSDLTRLGAGLKLECDIDLTALKSINKIDQVKQNVRKLGFALTEKKGNIYTLSTLCNLGYSETEIYLEFEKMASKLQDLEIESTKMLEATKHDELMDRIMRSEGVLGSAYLMSYDELDKIINNIRMGLNLNYSNMNIEKLNQIQKLTTNKKVEVISQSELKNLAEIVRNIVKGGENV